jgi:hypothetical protein
MLKIPQNRTKYKDVGGYMRAKPPGDHLGTGRLADAKEAGPF